MSIGMRLTKHGKFILAKGLTGKVINFSCVKIGSGDFNYDTENVFDLVNLRRYETTLPLTKCEVVGDGTVNLTARLSNAEVLEGFFASEIGVFALEPESGVEQLYSYVNLGNEASFIPSNTGPVQKDIRLSIQTIIADAENITATLNADFAYVSDEELELHINSEHPHLNTPNHYLDTDFASSIWVADNDNDLHKISIDDFKRQLTEQITPSPSRDEIYFAAKEELGIDANILMVEDFSGDSVVDNLKIKVSSCAMGGKLIGVESFEGLRCGYVYNICDGIFSESIIIKSIKRNESGNHIEIVTPLDYSYDINNTYIYRSLENGSQQVVLNWKPAEFAGYEANAVREISMSDNAQDYIISGGGGKLENGYLTL